MSVQTMTSGEAFLSVESLIHGRVRNFVRRNGGDYDELFSEALVAFTSAWEVFDPAKGKLTTLVHTCVDRRLYNTLSRRKPCLPLTEDVPAPEKSNFALSDFLEGLSEDAREVVAAVFDAPPEILLDVRSSKVQSAPVLRAAVKRYLRDLGWAWRRISETFAEIEGALR